MSWATLTVWLASEAFVAMTLARTPVSYRRFRKETARDETLVITIHHRWRVPVAVLTIGIGLSLLRDVGSDDDLPDHITRITFSLLLVGGGLLAAIRETIVVSEAAISVHYRVIPWSRVSSVIWSSPRLMLFCPAERWPNSRITRVRISEESWRTMLEFIPDTVEVLEPTPPAGPPRPFPRTGFGS